jgi:rod shape determining protein RodA
MLSVGMVLSMRYHYQSYMFSRDREDFSQVQLTPKRNE